MGPRGARQLVKLPRVWPSAIDNRVIAMHGLPKGAPSPAIAAWRRANLRNLLRGWRRVAAGRAAGVTQLYGAVWLDVFRADGSREPLGLASLRVVTDTGVAYLVDSLQNLTEPENLKFHGFGTGGTAEAAAQTALVTELTTQYATDNVRPTGSQTEAAANIYRTVGTLSPDATVAITEHGIFSQAAVAGGTMLDRSLFSVVNLVGSADSLQVTYDLTIASGG